MRTDRLTLRYDSRCINKLNINPLPTARPLRTIFFIINRYKIFNSPLPAAKVDRYSPEDTATRISAQIYVSSSTQLIRSTTLRLPRSILHANRLLRLNSATADRNNRCTLRK